MSAITVGSGYDWSENVAGVICNTSGPIWACNAHFTSCQVLVPTRLCVGGAAASATSSGPSFLLYLYFANAPAWKNGGALCARLAQEAGASGAAAATNKVENADTLDASANNVTKLVEPSTR